MGFHERTFQGGLIARLGLAEVKGMPKAKRTASFSACASMAPPLHCILIEDKVLIGSMFWHVA